jgi:hypothetical protein
MFAHSRETMRSRRAPLRDVSAPSIARQGIDLLLPMLEGRPPGRLNVTFLGLSAEKFEMDSGAAERGSLLKLFSAAANTDAPATSEAKVTQPPKAAAPEPPEAGAKAAVTQPLEARVTQPPEARVTQPPEVDATARPEAGATQRPAENGALSRVLSAMAPQEAAAPAPRSIEGPPGTEEPQETARQTEAGGPRESKGAQGAEGQTEWDGDALAAMEDGEGAGSQEMVEGFACASAAMGTGSQMLVDGSAAMEDGNGTGNQVSVEGSARNDSDRCGDGCVHVDGKRAQEHEAVAGYLAQPAGCPTENGSDISSHMVLEGSECGDGPWCGKRGRDNEAGEGDVAQPARRRRSDAIIPHLLPAEQAPCLADAVTTGAAANRECAAPILPAEQAPSSADAWATDTAAYREAYKHPDAGLAHAADASWACEACTLCNPAAARRCELCGALRGSALPAAATLSQQGGNAVPRSSRGDGAHRGAGASRGAARAGRGRGGRKQALSAIPGRGSLGTFFKRF